MNYQLNLDTLELSARVGVPLNLKQFIGGIYKISPLLFLQKEQNEARTRKTYPHCFRLIHKGELMGLLYSRILSPQDSPKTAPSVIRIENKVLYLYPLGFVLDLLTEGLELTNLRVKRMDIAYDSDTDTLTSFRKLYYDPSINFINRRKIRVHGRGFDEDQLSIGGYKNRVCYLSAYNKTLEVRKSGKEYIKKVHRKTFGYKTVYRVELRTILLRKTYKPLVRKLHEFG